MKQEPRSPKTVCPYSGIIAPDSEFNHPADVEAALELVKHAVIEDARAEISKMLRDAFRGSKYVQVKTTGGQSPRPKPRFHRNDLLRELVCDHCKRDYGVFAIGLYCPDCGAPNLRLHFHREAELVRMQASLAEAQTGENAELSYRLLGNAHEDVLTAFEATLKTVYLHASEKNGAEVKPVRTDFQNVDIARRRFSELSIDPFDCLDSAKLETLKLNIQKRHIIGHNLGIVDEKFAEHSDDAKIGETVHIIGEDVRAFATLAQKVVDKLDAWLGAGIAPTNALPLAQAPKVEQKPQKPRVTLQTLDVKLGPLARQVGLFFAETSKDGRSSFADTKALREKFSQSTEPELRQAIAELEHDGFVTTTNHGAPFPHVRTTVDLFNVFDPLAIGSDPTLDIVALVQLISEAENSVDVAVLHQQSGWSQRRFNPALSILISYVDDRRVSKTISSQYPSSHFILADTDRVALKRFCDRHAVKTS